LLEESNEASKQIASLPTFLPFFPFGQCLFAFFFSTSRRETVTQHTAIHHLSNLEYNTG